MEIVGVAAMLAIGFDIDVAMLRSKLQVMSSQVNQHEGDLEVHVKRRNAWEGVTFNFVGGNEDAAEGLVFGLQMTS